MSACFARPDTLALAGNTAMTDRRDDEFRIRPSDQKNRGKGFISKVLKQEGKANSGKSSVRRTASSGSGARAGTRQGRSAERRVGKECVSQGRSRGSP